MNAVVAVVLVLLGASTTVSTQKWRAHPPSGTDCWTASDRTGPSLESPFLDSLGAVSSRFRKLIRDHAVDCWLAECSTVVWSRRLENHREFGYMLKKSFDAQEQEVVALRYVGTVKKTFFNDEKGMERL